MFGGLGWLEGWWADWSEMVGFVQLWLGLGGIGKVFGTWRVNQLVVGEVEGFGLGVGQGAGFGGGAELAEDQAVFAQGGGDGAVVDLVEAGDLGGAVWGRSGVTLPPSVRKEKGFEGFGGVLLAAGDGRGGGAGSHARRGSRRRFVRRGRTSRFRELEVSVDGGVGDVQGGGDLSEGLAGLAEFVSVEDASASLWGSGHCGSTPVLLRG